MEHFSDQAWVDFTRGVSNPEHKEMESHLANGCANCIAAITTWKQVQTIAVREGSYSAPENAIRMAKLVFAEKWAAENARPEFARLTFDNWMNPALAGVRSAGAAARQMVYEVDGLAVDLRFDAPPSSTKLSLTGQVLDQRVPRASLEDAEVILWTQKSLPVAETKANAFGEFNVEFEAQNNLRLSIKVIRRAHIWIQLANLRAESEGEIYPKKADLSN